MASAPPERQRQLHDRMSHGPSPWCIRRIRVFPVSGTSMRGCRVAEIARRSQGVSSVMRSATSVVVLCQRGNRREDDSARVAAATRGANDETRLQRRRRPIASNDRSGSLRSTTVRWHDVNQAKEFVMKMHLVVVAALAALSSHAAFARYDGGDTWSELESKSYVPTSAFMGDLGPTLARYDGGDTWSDLQSKSHAGPPQSLTSQR